MYTKFHYENGKTAILAEKIGGFERFPKTFEHFSSVGIEVELEPEYAFSQYPLSLHHRNIFVYRSGGNAQCLTDTGYLQPAILICPVAPAPRLMRFRYHHNQYPTRYTRAIAPCLNLDGVRPVEKYGRYALTGS